MYGRVNQDITNDCFLAQLVDYLIPMLYVVMVLDTSGGPIEWLGERAHEHDVAVYSMLQP